MENKLPEGWEYKPLKDVCFAVKDKGNVGDCPYLEIGNIDLNSKRYVFTDKQAVKGCKQAQQKDVLISRVRPTRGAIVSIKENALAVSSAFTILRSRKEEISDRYLLRSLSGNQNFLNYMGNNCTGTMYPTVSEKVILDYLIPVAPVDKQERIADKLDSLLAKVKDTQSRLDKIPTILDRFRQSIFASAFSGELTKEWRKKNNIDAKWQEVKLGEVLSDLKYGTAKKCFREKKKHPVLRIPNVVRGCIDLTDLKYTDLDKKEYESLKLEAGDILLIRSNGSVSLVGRTALVTEKEKDMAYAGYLIRLRVNRGLIVPEFLQYQFQSYAMRLQIELPARSTSGVNNINSKEVKNLQIALPPLDEQKEVIRRLKASFAFLEKNEKEFNNAKSYTDKLEQSILAKAFCGELVKQAK
jgi:type I restriction enzyme, S subunit